MSIRRLVTGHNPDGKAVFVSDSQVDADRTPEFGFEFVKLWGADTPQRFPDAGQVPEYRDYFPPRSGYRFGLFTIPPATSAPLSREERQAAYQVMGELFPGLLGHMEPQSPGMHTSDSVDFGYVVSGSIWLELDDGVERELRAGDTYVQNGTRHAWRNRSAEPCTILVVLIGTERNPSGLEVAQRSIAQSTGTR
jgi:quercetin dioxygenase-like cupin family protein